jgi:Protein of unknown function (DUF3800)
VWAAHLLDEPVSVAQGDASLVVFVDDGEHASIAWRHPGGDIVTTADMRTSLARSPVSKRRPCHCVATASPFSYSVPEPPHSVVLQHLLERVDECVTNLGDYALVIADEVDGQAKHRADLSSYRDVGTTGYRHRKLTRIVDTLHFAPSHASRLVQAADVIAFLYRRVFTHEETNERSRAAKVAMWGRLQPRVHHELCWFPSAKDGQQHRWATDVR